MRTKSVQKMLQKPILKTGVHSKFVQNINQLLLESITNSQKDSVFHERFDSISGFLSSSKSYGLLTPCTNFCVSL